MRSKRISPPPIPLRLLRATWDIRGKAETGGHGLDLMLDARVHVRGAYARIHARTHARASRLPRTRTIDAC